MADVSYRARNHEQILAYRCQLRRLADQGQVKKPPTPDQPEANAAHGPKRPVAPAGGAAVEQVIESTKGGDVGVFHASIEKNFADFEMATDGNSGCHLQPER